MAHVALNHELELCLPFWEHQMGRPERSYCRRCIAASVQICTTPSAVRLMASAGQTSAQVGWSQCIQTTGVVCTELAF